jgi:hypothetical protein
MRRLAAMDRAEITDRLRQRLMAHSDLMLYRLGHDFSKAAQIASSNREPYGRFFFTPDGLPEICDLIRCEIPAQAEEIVRSAERICDHRFDLLGYENLDYGAEIDWHLDAVHGKHAPKIPGFKIPYLDYKQVGDAKITWELNRHQHFVTLAKAYLISGDERFAAEVVAQWERWWKENPYPIGINWASALEAAFRVQSWIWTFFLLQRFPLFTAEIGKRWSARLWLSGRHIENNLSTYFSPNTHLLGEGLALFSLGVLFPSPSAERWRQQGWAILTREAGRQVRDDGFYFEQSTYYHVYALDIFLHARILAELNGITAPEEFEKTLERMLDSLFFLSRAGIPHMFGDDDGGRLFDGRRNRSIHMLDPLATGATIYHRGDFKSVAKTLPEETIWLLGPKGAAEFDRLVCKEPNSESMAMAGSGSYLMLDAAAKQQFLIDAGPSGAESGGHGHADALSVSLIRDGHVLLRDSGTFEYVGSGRERSNFRGSGAHNTLRIDGRDQSKMAGPFSWGSFPAVQVERWINGKRFDFFEGSHDGYSRPGSTVVHRRQVFHPRDDLWAVRDVIEGDGEHEMEIAWHIGSGLAPEATSECCFSSGDQKLEILTAKSAGWSRTVHEVGWSPVYGRIEPAYVVRFTSRQQLPAELFTVLIAGRNAREKNGARVMKIGDRGTTAPSAYRYVDDCHDCRFVFEEGSTPWRLGGWVSDAEFLYVSIDRKAHMQGMVLFGGTFLDAGGQRILSCAQRVGYAEVWNRSDISEVFSSDQEAVKLGQSLPDLWAETESVPFEREPLS